jgi:hypothetical protein
MTMATIDNNVIGVGGGWPAQAHEEVNQLRKAITANMDEPMVSSSAAPMMGELLARLEGFSRPRDVSELQPPMPPEGHGEVSHGEAQALLHEACGSLREQFLSGDGDAQRAGALQAMVEVIENHLEMKSEVLARSASDSTPG